jgi:acetoin utilization deacetylase AcuC-like enzyme
MMSVHRGDGFWPSRKDAGADSVGKDQGLGFNVNVAWTGKDYGNPEYMHACKTVLFPIAEEFKPDLIIVSCGFDSAIYDPLGRF